MALILSYEDTRRMIDRCVISYKGQLAYVVKVDQRCVAEMVDAETGEQFRVLADFELIDNPKHNRIGYVNVEGRDARFLQRYSARVYRMGLSPDNLLEGNRGRLQEPLGPLLEGISNSYLNIYPSFAEAYELAKAGRKTIAYDRSFAVTKVGKIYYQGRACGQATGPDETKIIWVEKGLLKTYHRQRQRLNWK